MKTLIRPYDVTLIYAAYAKCKIHMAYAAYAKIQNTIFQGKGSQIQIIIKQLLNSVLVGYEELLRPRFVLSANLFVY